MGVEPGGDVVTLALWLRASLLLCLLDAVADPRHNFPGAHVLFQRAPGTSSTQVSKPEEADGHFCALDIVVFPPTVVLVIPALLSFLKEQVDDAKYDYRVEYQEPPDLAGKGLCARALYDYQAGETHRPIPLVLSLQSQIGRAHV